MINPMDLSDKKILIVGAASETGMAIVDQVKQLGATVAILDKPSDNLFEVRQNAGYQDVHAYSFDIYENKEIEPNLKQIISEFGTLNGFVYCAGIGGVRPLSLTKHSFISEMMNANLYTFIEMVRCISKNNNFADGGSIVAVSSVSSIKGLKSKTAYCASKAALDASVRCIAAELSGKRIRVNSVLKGWVESDMKKDFIKNNMDLNENEDYNRQLLGVIKPYEIANTVAFLLSDATKTITGISLILDGGYTL